MKVHCDTCGKAIEKATGQVNRARKIGAKLFCDRWCFGKSRRKGKTKEQKKLEKRLYDMSYRTKNRTVLKAKKADYFRRSYDPVKAARERKKRMHLHVEYCRQPRYKAYKREYDRQRRDSQYGPFAEVARLTINLNREIKQRMSNYEIRLENQTLNKRVARSRSSADTPSCNRHSRA